MVLIRKVQLLLNEFLDLARECPELKTLRSCDLLPVSWMFVTWNPINRIPMRQALKNSDACLLAYHSLSRPMKDSGNTQAVVEVYLSEMEGVLKISLLVFSHGFL